MGRASNRARELDCVRPQPTASAEWRSVRTIGWMIGLVALLGASAAQAVYVELPFSTSNTTNATQNFSRSATVEGMGFEATGYRATTFSITLLDADGDGTATLTPIKSGPLFDALINDMTALDITESLSCSGAGCVTTFTFGPVSGDLPNPISVDELSIEVNFRLSRGDSAAGVTRFEVVPEPGTLLLMGSGAAWLAYTRRRARS